MNSTYFRIGCLFAASAVLTSTTSAGLIDFNIHVEVGPAGGPPAQQANRSDLVVGPLVQYTAKQFGNGGLESPAASVTSQASARVGDPVHNAAGDYIKPTMHLSAQAIAHPDTVGNTELPPGGAEAKAEIVFTDELIFFPLFPVQIFEAVGSTHDVTIEGTITSTKADAYIRLDFDNNGSIDKEYGTTSAVNTVISEQAHWVREAGGWRSSLEVKLTAFAQITGNGTGDVQFANTVEFGNFRFFDQDGNPIYGTLTSARGFNYTLASQAVPEPASLTLVGMGAFGLVANAIRRRRQVKAVV